MSASLIGQSGRRPQELALRTISIIQGSRIVTGGCGGVLTVDCWEFACEQWAFRLAYSRIVPAQLQRPPQTPKYPVALKRKPIQLKQSAEPAKNRVERRVSRHPRGRPWSGSNATTCHQCQFRVSPERPTLQVWMETLDRYQRVQVEVG